MDAGKAEWRLRYRIQAPHFNGYVLDDHAYPVKASGYPVIVPAPTGKGKHMGPKSHRNAIVFAVPLLIVSAAAVQIGRGMRTVDFLQVFASGALFGVTLMGLIQALKKRNSAAS